MARLPIGVGSRESQAAFLRENEEFTRESSTRVRAAEIVLDKAAKAIELEDIEARVTELERAAEEAKQRR